jgi:transposase
MEDNTRRKFTKEYKLQIVHLVKDEQRKPFELAKDLGLETGMIYKWVRAYEKDPTSLSPELGKATEKEELRRLKKKLLNAYEENIILKKALAIFSKQQAQNLK